MKREIFKVASLGGGVRDLSLLQSLVNLGHEVRILGEPPPSLSGVKGVSSLTTLLGGVLILLAPASGVDETYRIKEPFGQEIILDESFFLGLKKGSLLFIGQANEELKKRATTYSINIVEYLHLPEVAILNAVPTAEGALQIALENLPTTIQGTKTLVAGLGRVGLALAWRLKALNAQVLGVNRSQRGLVEGEELGLSVIPLEGLDSVPLDMRLIMNTIPALIFHRSRLERLKKDTLIIDLASAPGGIDYGAAKDLNLKASLYPGLPGRFFPERAGAILSQLLPPIMEEEYKRVIQEVI